MDCCLLQKMISSLGTTGFSLVLILQRKCNAYDVVVHSSGNSQSVLLYSLMWHVLCFSQGKSKSVCLLLLTGGKFVFPGDF